MTTPPRRRLPLVSGFLAALLLAPAAAAAAAPPVFSTSTYEQAIEATKGSDKLLIVDATAVWCGPCKMMDRTTWIDEALVAWIGAHAVAIQVDVDRNRTVASGLRIQAMPTVALFRGGVEFDRVVGYRSAKEILDWLAGAAEGERMADRLRRIAGPRMGANGSVDVPARCELAKALLRRGDLDAATAEYLWLWRHMLTFQPSMEGVRLSSLAAEMQDLAARHEPARAALQAERDAHQAAVDGGTAPGDVLVDWWNLNEVLGDEDASLHWYECVRDDPGRKDALEPLREDVFLLLIERGRWAEAGAVIPDATLYVGRLVAWHGQALRYAARIADPAEREEARRSLEAHVLTRSGQVYAAALAAGRDDEASGAAAAIVAHLDGAATRLALVEAALRAGEPRRAHLALLDEAGVGGFDTGALRERVLEAILAP